MASSPAQFLEVPEPLWARFLPVNLILIATWRLSGWLRGKNRKARAYAIENNDPVAALFGQTPLPPFVGSAVRYLVGFTIRAGFERLAFGSDGARATYHSLPGVTTIENRTFLELPTPTTLAPSAAAPDSAAFVGRLEQRKGVALLMQAWELVEDRLPAARLRIIGDGPMRDAVSAWCAASPHRREHVAHVPFETIVSELSQFQILVAPSQRAGRWREQIGLPIVEALSSGVTIVTTSETGLENWLATNGHRVISGVAAQSLSAAIHSALKDPMDRQTVLSSLPTERGRIAASRWLLTD